MKQRELTIYKAILYFIIHQLFADVKADYDTISTKKHFDRFFNISLAIRDIKGSALFYTCPWHIFFSKLVLFNTTAFGGKE